MIRNWNLPQKKSASNSFFEDWGYPLEKITLYTFKTGNSMSNHPKYMQFQTLPSSNLPKFGLWFNFGPTRWNFNFKIHPINCFRDRSHHFLTILVKISATVNYQMTSLIHKPQSQIENIDVFGIQICHYFSCRNNVKYGDVTSFLNLLPLHVFYMMSTNHRCCKFHYQLPSKFDRFKVDSYMQLHWKKRYSYFAIVSNFEEGL